MYAVCLTSLNEIEINCEKYFPNFLFDFHVYVIGNDNF